MEQGLKQKARHETSLPGYLGILPCLALPPSPHITWESSFAWPSLHHPISRGCFSRAVLFVPFKFDVMTPLLGKLLWRGSWRCQERVVCLQLRRPLALRLQSRILKAEGHLDPQTTHNKMSLCLPQQIGVNYYPFLRLVLAGPGGPPRHSDPFQLRHESSGSKVTQVKSRTFRAKIVACKIRWTNSGGGVSNKRI